MRCDLIFTLLCGLEAEKKSEYLSILLLLTVTKSCKGNPEASGTCVNKGGCFKNSATSLHSCQHIDLVIGNSEFFSLIP